MSDNATAALMGDNGGAGDTSASDKVLDTNAASDTGTAPVTSPTEKTWTAGLNEDSLAYVNNKGWDSPDKVLESYRQLEKFAGGSKNLLELPGDEASADTMDAFYGKLGRPDTAEGYSFKASEGADADLDGWFRNTAYEMGLSDKQAATLYDSYNEKAGSQMESMVNQRAEQAEADVKAIQKEWGRDYEKNLDAGRIAVEALGYDQEALSQFEEKLGTADMLKLMSTIGSKMGEGDFHVDGNNGGFGTSPASARVEIEQLNLDDSFQKRYLSGDKDAVSKMSRLMSKAYG